MTDHELNHEHETTYKASRRLASERIIDWLTEEWAAKQERDDLTCVFTVNDVLHDGALASFDRTTDLWEGWRFTGADVVSNAAIPRVHAYDRKAELIQTAGTVKHRFEKAETGETLDVMTAAMLYADDHDHQYVVSYACLPDTFGTMWLAFSRECSRLARQVEQANHVVVLGGRATSFVPTVEWDQVVLPAELKANLLKDVESFFTKGIGIYQRLSLKPFRKLLLAGVPGTGKTMLCNALAKWALAKGYLVIYVSSARFGANFSIIDQAIATAAQNSRPTLMIIEELDAYLNAKDKALILNVLDGVESDVNPAGTMLISTTNYPEAIDERVLKRPGRLDRIFIIPEQRYEDDVEKMLRQYLGSMWQDEHMAIVPELVGYPGAFIREVAVYALTQVAYEDGEVLPLTMLEESFASLKNQIEARDDFLKQRNGMAFWKPGQQKNGVGKK